MIKSIFDLFFTKFDFFLNLTIEHLAICSIAIILATIIGGVAGVVISQYQQSSRLTIGMVNFLYTIPSISMLGFLIPLTGVGNLTAIIALTIYALLPMVRCTYTGITQVDPIIIEAAEGMGSTPWQMLYGIKLPLAFPVILSGLRNMVTMTIALGGVASFIGAGGLGVAIYRGITTNNPAMTILGSLLIALIALFFDYLLGVMEVRSHRYSSKKNNRSIRLLSRGSVALAALVLLFFFVKPIFSPSQKPLHIATKPVTEGYILGEMLRILINEHSDIPVKITYGVGGGTSNIHPGLMTGDFDLYPDYTGTAWNMVLHRKDLYQELYFDQLSSYYIDTLGLEWVGMYGFASNYAIAVQNRVIDKYGLKNLSDLSPYSSELVFGAEYDFYDRLDGYEALCKLYNLDFQKTMDLDMGLKYKALQDKQVDVMPLATTDAQLSQVDVSMLHDDRMFFPSYECGTIVRRQTLEQYPELRSILMKMQDIITAQEMSSLNYQVEVEGREHTEVAREFLHKKGRI